MSAVLPGGSDQLDLLLADHALAVVAADPEGLLPLHVEAGADRVVVRDAGRVGAADHARDLAGDEHRQLPHDPVVPDDRDGGVRAEEGDLFALERLTALAERAGTRVRGVFRFDMSRRTKSANAALMGIGNTRRIVLGDTLLEEFTADEIETVLAHELGHHVHNDIWLGIAAVAAPVVVHLLTRPRPVRLPLSTLRFVREAVRQRRARSWLRDLLVLLLRTAAVILLALAVARPQKPRRLCGED